MCERQRNDFTAISHKVAENEIAGHNVMHLLS